MSDLNFPDPQQEYSAESFGTPATNQPKKRRGLGGASAVLLIFGGCAAFILICCLCCLGLFFLTVREPVGAVSFYGGALTTNNYEVASFVVCEGSQAERETNALEAAGVTFNSFSAEQNSLGTDSVDVTAEITRNGVAQDWFAIFTVEDGGSFPFSQCISRIEVR